MSLRTPIVLLLCALLSGCLGPGRREPVRILDLDVAAPAVMAEASPLQLTIQEPRASQSLDLARIAVRPAANELRYYAGAAWRDRAPRLLHDAILRAFEDAAAFRAVGRSGNGLRGDLVLELELRRFEAIYAGDTPNATVALQATLIDRDGRALGSQRISAEAAASATEVGAVAAAFGRAIGKALHELVQWTQRTAAGTPAP